MKIHELGHIVLYVTDITKVANFYRDTLGFAEIHREGPIALFSSGRTHHEMLLIEIGPSTSRLQQAPVRGTAHDTNHLEQAPVQGAETYPRRPKEPSPGLYHIGFKVADSHEELKAVYKELQQKNVPIVGLADHTVTHSIYVMDPDGNELELYADVSDEWKTNPMAVLAPTRALSLD